MAATKSIEDEGPSLDDIPMQYVKHLCSVTETEDSSGDGYITEFANKEQYTLVKNLLPVSNFMCKIVKNKDGEKYIFDASIVHLIVKLRLETHRSIFNIPMGTHDTTSRTEMKIYFDHSNVHIYMLCDSPDEFPGLKKKKADNILAEKDDELKRLKEQIRDLRLFIENISIRADAKIESMEKKINQKSVLVMPEGDESD